MAGMFGHINLVKSQCQELRITTHFTLSHSLGERVMTVSHNHAEKNLVVMAVYGELYSINNNPHALRVDVRRSANKPEDYHISFRAVAAKWSKPPKQIKNPSVLIDMLNAELQDTEWNCIVTFIYGTDKWRPIVEVPYSLSTEEEQDEDETFTHVEGLTYSRREHGKIKHSVQIGARADSSIIHYVRFDERWQGKLTNDFPIHVLKHSSDLSRYFLMRRRRRKK